MAAPTSIASGMVKTIVLPYVYLLLSLLDSDDHFVLETTKIDAKQRKHGNYASTGVRVCQPVSKIGPIRIIDCVCIPLFRGAFRAATLLFS